MVMYYARTKKNSAVVSESEKKWALTDLWENAGLDVYGVSPPLVIAHTAYASRFEPGEEVPFTAIVKTHLAVALPNGIHMEVAGRSGLRLKYGITPFYGTIDNSYRGEIKVILNGRIKLPGNSDALETLSLSLVKTPEPLNEVFGRNIILSISKDRPDRLLELYEESLEENTIVEASTCVTPTAIAQLRFLNYAGRTDLPLMKLEEASLEDLGVTTRGDRGFGSSG